MPSLQAYDKALSYSYAPGAFPAAECFYRRPEQCRRLLIHSKADGSEGVLELAEKCGAVGIRVEVADKALARVSGKGNCFAAMVFEKWQSILCADAPHIVLHEVSDGGNMGTILRTALGFGYANIAIVRPAADVFDPHVIRASMGAAFSQSIAVFDSYAQYREEYHSHEVYPFMLDGSVPLQSAAPGSGRRHALIFGNEGRGLPGFFAGEGTPVRIPHAGSIDSLNVAVAAAIGMYAFSAFSAEGR